MQCAGQVGGENGALLCMAERRRGQLGRKWVQTQEASPSRRSWIKTLGIGEAVPFLPPTCPRILSFPHRASVSAYAN